MILPEGLSSRGFVLPDESTWDVKVENDMKEGKATIQNENGIIQAILFFEHNKLNGICSFYDKGRIKEMITFVNDIAEGWGCDYEDDKEVAWFIYKNGNKLNELVKFDKMDGYWKEQDIKTKTIVSICQFNENHNQVGKCYFYENGLISKIVHVENGEEKHIIKEFKKGVMSEYDDQGELIYQGDYENSIDNDYPRNSDGIEFEKENYSYYGDWLNNKRDGYGIQYKNNKVYYEGKWKNNLPEGQGKLLDENGNIKYEGKWKKGLYVRDSDNVFDYISGEEIKNNHVRILDLLDENTSVPEVIIRNEDDLHFVMNHQYKSNIFKLVFSENSCCSLKGDLVIDHFDLITSLTIENYSLLELTSLTITNNYSLEEIVFSDGYALSSCFYVKELSICCNILYDSIMY